MVRLIPAPSILGIILKLLADLASWRFFYDLSGKIELIPAPLIAFGVKLIDEAHLFL